MKDMGKVQGSEEQAQPIVFGKDTVYVHSNITPLGNGLYEYDEVQYWIYEYMAILQQQVTDTELALVEIYEGLGGGTDG